jgi:hypothetical protein
MADRFITIHKVKGVYERMNSRPSMDNHTFKQGLQSLCAPLGDGGIIDTGLTVEEKEKYLPQVLQMRHDDRLFHKAVEDYYTELSVTIPNEGLKLNIGVSEETGTPEKVRDFLAYKFIKRLKSVAKSENYVNDLKHSFYIQDEELEQEKALEDVEARKEASKIFLNMKDDRFPLFLYLLKASGVKELEAINIDNMPANEQYLQLEKLITIYPRKIISIQSEVGTPKNPGNAFIKFFIERLVTFGIWNRQGNKHIYNTEPLGDLDQSIAWVKDAKNSSEVTLLQAKLDELTENKAKLRKKK